MKYFYATTRRSSFGSISRYYNHSWHIVTHFAKPHIATFFIPKYLDNIRNHLFLTVGDFYISFLYICSCIFLHVCHFIFLYCVSFYFRISSVAVAFGRGSPRISFLYLSIFLYFCIFIFSYFYICVSLYFHISSVAFGRGSPRRDGG